MYEKGKKKEGRNGVKRLYRKGRRSKDIGSKGERREDDGL